LKNTLCTLPSTTPSMLPSTLLGVLARMPPIALVGSPPASLTIYCQVRSQVTLKHTPEHVFNYTCNCIAWHTSNLLTIHSQDKPSTKILPCTFQASPQIHLWVFSSSVLSIISRMHLIALNGTLLASVTVHLELSPQDTPTHTQKHGYLQVHSQESRLTQSELTIYNDVCIQLPNPENCRVACTRNQEDGSRGHMVAEMMMLVDIMLYMSFCGYPPARDLTMIHSQRISNCILTFCLAGRQLHLRVSRSLTPILQGNLPLPPHT